MADAVTSRRSRDTAKSNMLAVGVMVAMAGVEVAMVVVVVDQTEKLYSAVG